MTLLKIVLHVQVLDDMTDEQRAKLTQNVRDAWLAILDSEDWRKLRIGPTEIYRVE